ncbi:hypothetical protein V8G54_026270 [Vigna mungo]|uniref:Uncharacterized protein n=1 Tax=Vigna mungo TaxID=3915 RepID=A0AAQ3N0R0_VIGMU
MVQAPPSIHFDSTAHFSNPSFLLNNGGMTSHSFHSPPTLPMARQQKVLRRSPPVTRCREGCRAGEVAGNATAACAAVCCCVPCTVMDVVVLAAYKVPAGLVRKAMHKRKRRQLQKKNKKTEALLDHGPDGVSGPDDVSGSRPSLEENLSEDVAEDTSKLEEEMWAQFNGTGFWRSDSQRLEQQGEQPTAECHCQAQ